MSEYTINMRKGDSEGLKLTSVVAYWLLAHPFITVFMTTMVLGAITFSFKIDVVDTDGVLKGITALIGDK
jgi:hypothetical protein